MGKNISKNVVAFIFSMLLVTILSTFDITSVGNKAFSKYTKATSLTLGNKLKTIGQNAFSNNKKLKKITIKSTKLNKIGKNAFKGIHKKAVFKLPKSKLKSYKKLIKKAGVGKKVTYKK